MSQLMTVSRLEDNKTSSVRENEILANMTDFCIREFTGRLQTLRSWVSFFMSGQTANRQVWDYCWLQPSASLSIS